MTARQQTLAAGLIVMMTAITSSSLMAAANPGEIGVNFKGQVVDNTCTWYSGYYDARMDNQTGILSTSFPRTSRSNFKGIGSVGATGVVRLRFNGCGQDVTTVKIRFSGPTSNAIHALDGILISDLEWHKTDTTESGVGYQLWDITGTTQLKSDDASEAGTLTVALTPASGMYKDSDYHVDLQSRLVQTGNEPPALGNAHGTGTLTIFWP